MRDSEHEQADEAEHDQRSQHTEDEFFLSGDGKGHGRSDNPEFCGRGRWMAGGEIVMAESEAEGGEVGQDLADERLVHEFMPGFVAGDANKELVALPAETVLQGDS